MEKVWVVGLLEGSRFFFFRSASFFYSAMDGVRLAVFFFPPKMSGSTSRDRMGETPPFFPPPFSHMFYLRARMRG